MKNRYNDDALLLSVVEHRVWKTVDQDSAERPMNDLERQRTLTCQRDRSVDSVYEIAFQFWGDVLIPGFCLAKIALRFGANDHLANHSLSNDLLTSSHGSPSSGRC